MGVHYPLGLIAPIANVRVASGTDPLHWMCFSQSSWDDKSILHIWIFQTLPNNQVLCRKRGVLVRPSSSVLQSHPVMGWQVPVEPCGGQCLVLFFSSPAWQWEWWCSVSPPQPDAVGALVKALCCENPPAKPCVALFHEDFWRDPVLRQAEGAGSLQY